MADISPAAKARTITHMNADHSLDLGLYLRHVNGLSADQLAAEGHPEMVDIYLDAMHIRTRTSGTVHIVPLDPPMKSWTECRTRLVDLALAARRAYGVPLPEHTPKFGSRSGPGIPFEAPEPLGWFMYGLVGALITSTALVATGHDAAVAGAWARTVHAIGIPDTAPLAGVAGFRKLVRHIGLPVVVIHMTEMFFFERLRLAPRGMRFGRDWWAWMGTVLAIGFGGFVQFGHLAKKADAEAAEKKH